MSGALLWVGVAVCGGAGALVRFAVERAVSWRAGVAFPLGILVVNLTGAALLGALAGSGASRDVMLLAGTAILGAYTTFSTWMFDTELLLREGRARAAAVNVVASVVLGIAVCALARSLT